MLRARFEAAKTAKNMQLLLMSCVGSLCPIICSTTFMGLYWAMYVGASDVNEVAI